MVFRELPRAVLSQGLYSTGTNLIVERVEVYRRINCDDSDGSASREFKSDTVVFTRGRDIYVSRNTIKLPCDDDIDLEHLEAIKVDRTEVFPLFDSLTHTLAPQPLPFTCYLKLQSLRNYTGKGGARSNVSKFLMSREAKACEMLRKPSHRNIATYFGCVVEDGLIVALCFERYQQMLQERLADKERPLDAKTVLQGIQDGVDYIHSFGYCHNDIHDMNIMLDDNDTPVLVDFDACLPEGETLSWKGGAPGWCPDVSISRKENDFFSLKVLKDYLEKGVFPVADW